jgi:hypothetical protein
MKAAVVKRWRDRSEPNVARAASRWRFYAFGALSISTVLAACEPQVPGGFFREARSGEAAAESERVQRGKSGNQPVRIRRTNLRGVFIPE